MIENYLSKIINSHKSAGMIEEANMLELVEHQQICYNIYTLKLKSLYNSNLDINFLNAQIIKEIKKNPNLYKEIREFTLFFRFLKKLKINNGYIMKSETPDFILERNNKKYGIEVTRIYTGNDWVAEKLHNDILAYKLKDTKLSEYINYKKYDGRIKTYKTEKGIVVKAVKDKSLKDEEIIQIKNKIFEKIRKQIDDYNKYEYNYIFAEIVFTAYEELEHFEKLSKEINFLISHLDAIWGNAEYHLILKVGNHWADFDLRRGEYKVL
ncbi:MAG: hypothetical protein J6C46_01750 [Clostridia bacterium]|nr:hypothetical protein [Clostridia bacterium]